MTKNLRNYTIVFMFGLGFLHMVSACPADGALAAQAQKGETKSTGSENGTPAIDSLHAVVKGFRGQQNKKIVQLRDMIDVELSKSTIDKKLVEQYIDEQSQLRASIERKWIETLYVVKSLVKQDQFDKNIKENWGCNCGDADCSCVPKKNADNNIPITVENIVGTGNLAKTIDSLQTVVSEFKAEQGKVIRELRDRIEQELGKISTNEKLIDQYVSKQTELRTSIEKRWMELFYKVKSMVPQGQFLQLVKNNWGCTSGEADCGCIKKEIANK